MTIRRNMLFVHSQFTRVIPTENSLNIILKNTHFKEDLLAEKQKISLHIDYSNPEPILSVAFQEPFYDFQEKLTSGDFLKERGVWLKSYNIMIRLILADSVIGDEVSTRTFVLNSEESSKLKAALEK